MIGTYELVSLFFSMRRSIYFGDPLQYIRGKTVVQDELQRIIHHDLLWSDADPGDGAAACV